MDSAYLHRTNDYASLVHELGHQWFYNVVGNNPITESWLDEGMTLYVQESFFHEDEQSFHEKMMGEYQQFKARADRFVIANELGAFENWRDYYLTHYTKAKLMLYALNLRMGDEAFWHAIKQYYQAYSFRIATLADFIAIVEDAHGEGLQEFFDEWIFGDHVPELGD
jgi:aminopeptidase N